MIFWGILGCFNVVLFEKVEVDFVSDVLVQVKSNIFLKDY